ncbi:MAG: TnpV protein [Roseburia faecis]
MNITYEKNGDYLIPNLISDPEPEGELRKFGLMRRHYLKEHRSGIYRGDAIKWKTKGTFAYDAGTGRGAV